MKMPQKFKRFTDDARENIDVKFWRNWFITVSGFVGTILVMHMCDNFSNKEDDVKYLVVSKFDKQIVFEDIDQYRVRRTMYFIPEHTDRFYKNIHPGDTLTGRYMNRDTFMPSNLRGVTPAPRIRTINGHPVDKIVRTR